MLTIYRGPMGEWVEDPDAAFLRRIADQPSAYWARGGGDSALETEGSDERMVFFFDEPFGFFMMMHPDYEVVVRQPGPIIAVEHDVGGEPMRVPSCSYFSRDEAYELMLEFVAIGGRPMSVKWQDMYDLDFDDGF